MSELPPTTPDACATVRRKWFASILFRIFRPWTAEAAAVDADTLRLLFRSRSHSKEIPLGDIESVELKTGRYWARVRIRHASKKAKKAVASGLPRKDAQRFVEAVETARTEWWRRELAKHSELLHAVHKHVVQLETRSRYITSSIYRYLKCEAPKVSSLLRRQWPDTLSDDPEVQRLKEIRSFLSKLDTRDDLRKQANDDFIEIELERSREFFDTVDSHPLTEEQRRAIVVDEDRNLVVAAAGSGKTSVIVAKAGWITNRGDRRPKELLLLAFNKNAKRELAKRVRRRLGDEVASKVRPKTFHSLGLSIIADVENRKPAVHKVATDKKKLAELLQKIVGDLYTEGDILGALLRWFQSQFAPYQSEHKFQNWKDYEDYIRRYEIRSLKGEKVKSFGECEIANFLFLHGVPYEYEADYKHDTATRDRRKYQPDFYLPDHEIYIEHWGIDESGNTAPFIDREEYIEAMKWKLQLHKENDTTLIETFSHESRSDTLIENLANKLIERDVSLSPISKTDIFEILKKQNRINPFINLLSTFLHHCKGAQQSFEEVSGRIQGSDGYCRRAEAFLNIFRPVFERYEETIRKSGKIDFHDMINQATELVKKGRYTSPFGYILVDEFQDISQGRAKLIKALLDQSSRSGKDMPPTQLFAVGDDWQAIYRFAGSDISIMRDFEKHFGDHKRVDLETTFRCAEPIATAATRFVLENSDQLRKTVHSTQQEQGPCLHIGFPGKGISLLDEALTRIATDAAKHKRASKAIVLLLGRYKRLKPQNLSSLSRTYRRLQISYKTVHKSKGLEADYVIVLGLSSGRYGFPSEITDDSLLDLVLPKPERHLNAEERRLFYVAMTRAKRRVFLLADGDTPSSFITELIDEGYNVDTFGRPRKKDVPCPICAKGRMVSLKNKESGETFYGCSYPYCKHTQPACSSCESGLPILVGEWMRCRDCDKMFSPCPECFGWMHPRTNNFGRPFYGCSNCKHSHPPCSNCGSGLLARVGGGTQCRDCGERFPPCPECSGSLRRKDGPYGPFLGCSNYTNGCRYKRRL